MPLIDCVMMVAGKALRAHEWNGGTMRRRFQTGHILARGKRRRVWVGRYLEPILIDGKVKSVLRSRVLGACVEMSKSVARRELQDILKPLNEGQYNPVESISFNDFYAKWERDLLPTFRESTRGFYHATARRWIVPYFDGRKLDEIRPADLQQFINLFAERYSRSVLKHLRATLNCLWATAVTWRYTKDNPTAGLRLPEGKPVRQAPVLQPAQIAALLDVAREPYRTMILLAAITAARESELLALRWTDVDLEMGTVHVSQRIYRGLVAKPKTGKSDRVLPLCPAGVAALVALGQSQYRRGEYIFTNPAGAPYNAEGVARRVFRPLAMTLDLPAFTWRSFRRSAETSMHNSGVPLKVQQEIMGHANPKMTLVYAEADEAGKRLAVKGLGDGIFPKFSQVVSVGGNAAPN